MQKDEFKVLSTKINTLQDGVDLIDRDMAQDREEIQQMTIRLGAVESQIDELRKLVTQLPQKTQDKVIEAAAPIIEEAQGLSKQISRKKTMVIREKTKSLWRKLLRR